MGADWSYRRFRGARWEQVRDSADQNYLTNKYRVLLTRARQGMVIFVPRGSDDDPTRPPEIFDAIASFLKSCGVSELETIRTQAEDLARRANESNTLTMAS